MIGGGWDISPGQNIFFTQYVSREIFVAQNTYNLHLFYVLKKKCCRHLNWPFFLPSKVGQDIFLTKFQCGEIFFKKTTALLII